MSKPHPPAAHGGAPAAPNSLNEDGMNIVKIVVIGVVSLVIFAVSAVVAGLIVSADEQQMAVSGIAPLPADIQRKQEIGIIDYVMFDADHRLDTWRAAKQQELKSYGWADRSKGLARMPIDQAMKEVIEKAAAGGAGK